MYTVAKRNKRLHIIDESGTSIYTPPDFIKKYITNRQKMVDLAEKMNNNDKYDHILLIMEFEYSV